MIIDKSNDLTNRLKDRIKHSPKTRLKITVDLWKGEEHVRTFTFQGNFPYLLEKIMETETFAFNYMKDHRCNLEAEMKFASLAEK